MTAEFPRWLGMILTIAGMGPAVFVSGYVFGQAMRRKIVFMPPMSTSEGNSQTPKPGK
jgi:hypothetical protein